MECDRVAIYKSGVSQPLSACEGIGFRWRMKEILKIGMLLPLTELTELEQAPSF